MMKTLGLVLTFAALVVGVWMFGARAIRLGHDALPASWTKQGTGQTTVSLISYGADRFLRQSLFGSMPRRVILFAVLAVYAIASMVVLGSLLRGTLLSLHPEWSWWDAVWALGGAVVLWEAMPSGEAVQISGIFLKDAAVAIWILALARARRITARDVGWSLTHFAGDIGRGVISAILILPLLSLVLLAAVVLAGSSSIPGELAIPAPPSRAAAVLMILILPLLEELFFRGFVYRLLRSNLPELFANVLCSALFGAAHGDTGLFLAARFIGSLLMCRLYDRTGTLWSSLAAHATFNAILLLGPAVLL